MNDNKKDVHNGHLFKIKEVDEKMNTKIEAVEYAIKTMELEGFSFSAEERILFEKVANEEITTKEMREYAICKIIRNKINS